MKGARIVLRVEAHGPNLEWLRFTIVDEKIDKCWGPFPMSFCEEIVSQFARWYRTMEAVEPKI